MNTPWNEYPDLWPTSISWRTGDGEQYLSEWHEFFEDLNDFEKKAYIKENKAPFYWFYFYIFQNKDLVAWYFTFVILMGLTYPFRRFQFNRKLKELSNNK